MRCRDVMRTAFVRTRPGDTITRCARQMQEQNIRMIPVLDEGGRLLGILTDRGLALAVLAGGTSRRARVSTVIEREVVVCGPEEELRDAARRLFRSASPWILVVGEGRRVLGVIGLAELAAVEDHYWFGRVFLGVAASVLDFLPLPYPVAAEAPVRPFPIPLPAPSAPMTVLTSHR